MIILTIRTDKSLAEIGLFSDTKELSYEKWEAHRQLTNTIHNKILGILAANKLDLKDIEGIVVFKGPGSFTGLRIGISVANSLAYALNVPIIGSTEPNWIMSGIEKLQNEANEIQILPEYGSPVFTTKPKK